MNTYTHLANDFEPKLHGNARDNALLESVLFASEVSLVMFTFEGSKHAVSVLESEDAKDVDKSGPSTPGGCFP